MSRTVALGAGVVGLTLITIGVLSNIGQAPYVELQDTGQAPTEAPSEPSPSISSPTEVTFARSPSIYWASDAISRSLEIFPDDHHPYDEIAGLLYKDDFNSAWMQALEPDPDVNPREAVWLVGIRGIGLTEDDIFLPLPFLTPPATYVPRGVDGAFYAWDENDGYLIAEGVLGMPASDDFDLDYELLVTVLTDYRLTE